MRATYRLAIVPPEPGDVHELGIFIEEGGDPIRVPAHPDGSVLVGAGDANRFVTGGDDGRVVELGPHGDLVEAGGRYAELHRSWVGNTRETSA